MSQEPCPTCSGRGRLRVRKPYPKHHQFTKEFARCDFCAGTGRVFEAIDCDRFSSIRRYDDGDDYEVCARLPQISAYAELNFN